MVWGSQVPYLQAMASPGDKTAPGYQSEKRFTPEEIRDALKGLSPAVTLQEDPAKWFGTPILSDAGTVASLPVGDATLPGTKVRQLLGLRSAAFTVTYAEGEFLFTVSGYGHGVGMSQYGADYLARQGDSYAEILAHYYAGTTLEAVAPDDK